MTFTKITALVYCGDQFGLVDGKTAAGLVRHSETYNIVGIIDRAAAGQDAGVALGEAPNGIPIFADLAMALAALPAMPS
jgi:uncharacterized NAD-dependent epimerase/dehydratase family protein